MLVNVLFCIALVCTIILPVGAYFIGKNKTRRSFKRTLITNIGSFVAVFAVATVVLFSGNASAAEEASSASGLAQGLGYIAAALSISCSCLGSGYAVASSASSALGALSEDQSVFGKALIFVALAEGIALWGFIVAFLIISNL